MFARAYERIVAPASRRRLGTYFTPPEVVDIMTGILSAVIDPAVVVDAGAGVGALTLAARRTWPDAQIHAVDINAASLGLLAVAAGSAPGPAGAGGLRLAVADYLDWVHGWTGLPAPRALLANPPYTRHQARTSQEKDAAAKASGQLMPRRTGSLSTYMLAATLWRLGPADAICLLLPDNWLDAGYARDLRDALWSLQDRRLDLYALPDDQTVFPDARVSAMVLLVAPATRPGQPAAVHRLRRVRDRLRADRSVVSAARGRLPDDPLRALWRRGRAAPARPSGAATARGRGLNEIVLVRRGIATGSNKTFLLDDDGARGVPPANLRPAVHRLATVQGNEHDPSGHERAGKAGLRRWLLDVPNTDSTDPAVKALLDKAVAAGVPNGVLCSRRETWCALPFPDEPPPLLISPSSNGSPFRVVRNTAGAFVTNNLLGVHARPGKPLTDSQWEALAAWLREDDAQRQWRGLARVHSGGLRKLEPKAARSVRVPKRLADALLGQDTSG